MNFKHEYGKIKADLAGDIPDSLLDLIVSLIVMRRAQVDFYTNFGVDKKKTKIVWEERVDKKIDTIFNNKYKKYADTNVT